MLMSLKTTFKKLGENKLTKTRFNSELLGFEAKKSKVTNLIFPFKSQINSAAVK